MERRVCGCNQQQFVDLVIDGPDHYLMTFLELKPGEFDEYVEDGILEEALYDAWDINDDERIEWLIRMVRGE